MVDRMKRSVAVVQPYSPSVRAGRTTGEKRGE